VPAPGLLEMSLEDLLSLEVTLVSRKPESKWQAPAAIHVVTQQDIANSGVTSIPEALRLVPGIHVARIESDKWAISARGLNGRFASRMLVLMDGRSVYTPLFSGVLWELQDTVIEDIERIEVIRGPGGTMWGANAVNGVVNIVTKSAKNTQGGLLTLGTGTEESGFMTSRYGGQLGENAWYRVYVKGVERDTGLVDEDTQGHDDWRAARAGFRIDWDMSPSDEVTVQGDWYAGAMGQETYLPNFDTFIEDIDVAGGNLLARWSHEVDPLSNVSLQAYYDRTEREEAMIEEDRDTFDLDFQWRLPVFEKHEVVWGLGYRYTTDRLATPNPAAVDVSELERDNELLSTFVQDKFYLVPDRLELTLGAKIERNDYTGTELQPNLRLAYTPNERHMVWGAVSRAVRTPSRLERSVTLARLLPNPVPPPALIPAVMTGDDRYDAEKLTEYEVGYRVRATERVSIDVAMFYGDYDDLESNEVDGFGPPIALSLGNRFTGEAYGVEVSTVWQVRDWWRMSAWYAFMRLHLHPNGSGDAFSESNFENDYPESSAGMLNTFSVNDKLTLNAWLRYADGLPSIPTKDHLDLDLQVTWRATPNVELSIVGQNLLDQSHAEYGPSTIVATQTTEVERGVYGKLTWRF